MRLSQFNLPTFKKAVTPQTDQSPVLRHRENSVSSDREANFYKRVRRDKDKKNKKSQRQASDFELVDHEKRNVLHRAALEQSEKLINDVLQEYLDVIKQEEAAAEAKALLEINPEIQMLVQQEPSVRNSSKKTELPLKQTISERMREYISKPDCYGCSAILICCFLNEQRSNSSSNESRRECLEALLKRGADVNDFNPVSFWAPIHWCAYYGDKESCQLLIQHQAITFICDREGMFPLDLAGTNEQPEVVKLLLEHLVTLLTECQQFWNNSLIGKPEDEFIQFQVICQQYKKELTNPILFSKLLYWSCKYEQCSSFIVEILNNLPRVYVQVPINTLRQTNPIQAAINADNFKALKMLFKFEMGTGKQTGQVDQSHRPSNQEEVQLRQSKKDKSHLRSRNYVEHLRLKDEPTEIFNLPWSERKKYKSVYVKEIQIFEQFERQYFEKIQKCVDLQTAQSEEDKREMDQAEKQESQLAPRQRFHKRKFIVEEILAINCPDFFGNTALHMASLRANEEIVKHLLKNHADTEAENKEFFKARQLTKNQKIMNIYKEYMKELKHHAKEKNEFMMRLVEMMHKLNDMQPKQLPYFGPELDHSVKKILNSQTRKQLRLYSAELFVPDIVIVCKIKLPKDQKDLNDQKHVKEQRDLNSNTERNSTIKFNNLSSIFSPSKGDQSKSATSIVSKLNFQISLLQNAEFDVYLMNSYLNPSHFYIMLRLPEKKLEALAEEMELQVKLIDSYDLEPFQLAKQELFEPFRSRQRQLIAEYHLKKSINIDSLIKSRSVSSYFPMHTAGGIQIVKEHWLQLSKHYLPQPINQMGDYLSEGKSQNFRSLTVLRLYFGEKISFYFAWLSFQTCALIFLALPGAALQIYILQSDDYQNDLILLWAIAVCIWSTIINEFWKRKTSEINTRWGCIDLMLAEKSETYTGPVREGFSGDEEVNFVTGKLTKHQKLTKTTILFVLFIAITACFISFSLLSIFAIDATRGLFSVQDDTFFLLLGAIEALVIMTLNSLFSRFADWYAEKENHKYVPTYEKSLIYKNVLFKGLNYYLPVLYFIVVRDDVSLKSLFYFLLPLLLVKKLHMIFIDSLPAFYVKGLIYNYFARIRELSINLIYQDPIEDFWQLKINTKISSVGRPVLKISSNKSNSQSGAVVLEKFLDTDAVELNSQRRLFEGTLNYYMEGVIDYGYATIFAAVFPGAPLLVSLINILEINLKINRLLYMTRRQKSERCAGIGEWTNVIAFQNLCGICTNFILLYYKNPDIVSHYIDTSYLNIFNRGIGSGQDSLGVFLLLIILLVIFTQFISDLIPDKPEWVRMEIDKINFRNELEKQKDTQKKTKEIETFTCEKNAQKTQCDKENSSLQEKAKIQIAKLDEEIIELKRKLDAISTYGTQTKKIQKLDEAKTEYDMIFLGVLRMRFLQLDFQLTVKRIQQIINSGQVIELCEECSFKPCVFECVDCQQNFCGKCYIEFHTRNHYRHKVHLIVEDKYIEEDLTVQGNKQLKPQNVYIYSDEYKKKIPHTTPSKQWKKLEYFSIPVSETSPNFKFLQQIYDLFLSYYLKDPGFEFRDFRIQVNKIWKMDLTPLVENEHFNIEEKLFLNRIAYSTFKAKMQKSLFQHFLKLCQNFQDGMLEQKLLILYDFLDRSQDEMVSKDELENIFLQSHLQNFGGNQKVSDLIQELCPEDEIEKKAVVSKLLHGVTTKKYRPFLEGLLQTID